MDRIRILVWRKGDIIKLSSALKGIKKVIETEGDLEIEQIIIKKDKFSIQIKDKWYNVDNYNELMNNKGD